MKKRRRNLSRGALIGLGASGVFPPSDLADFLDRPDPLVRAAALQGLATRKKVPDFVREQILKQLDDPSVEVRLCGDRDDCVSPNDERRSQADRDGIEGRAPNRSRARLGGVAGPESDPGLSPRLERSQSRRARPANWRSPSFEIRPGRKSRRRRAAKLRGPAALAVERALARFKPIIAWKAIGPFPRTTAQVFLGEASIDFSRVHSGASGKTIAWTETKGDPRTGRVSLEHFKAGAGDRGGFGYDRNGSPDLAAFAAAEIDSDADRPALLLIGSSGSVVVTLNEQFVHVYQNFAGRRCEADSDLVRIHLNKGKNRLLVQTRQGVGVWSFGVQVSEPTKLDLSAKTSTIADLRVYAIEHEGDRAKGEAIFLNAKGIGCVKCHSAAGKGKADVGPDLTGLALKYDKAEIIRSVLEPSNRLATGYQPTVIALKDGRVLSGVIRSETETELVMSDAEARMVHVQRSEIDERKIGEVSIMPAGAAESLSLKEFADLIAFLTGLKTAPAAKGAQVEAIRSK